MTERSLSAVLSAVRAYRGPDVFNPYAQRDARFDRADAPGYRLANLHAYLSDRASAPIALIGEAAGYNGGRFTGIAFTCEAQLAAWGDARYRPSSLSGDRREGSALAVWPALIARGADAVLWNAFPWHPHQSGRPMTNRRPTAAEGRVGRDVLARFLEWLQPGQVIAVGRTAERALAELGVVAPYVRHPAHGGQRAFVEGVHSALNL